MMSFIKRAVLWLFQQLISLYAPPLCIVIFAVFFFQIFPEGPVWPVGIFAVLMVIIFGRYVKW